MTTTGGTATGGVVLTGLGNVKEQVMPAMVMELADAVVDALDGVEHEMALTLDGT